MDPQNPNPVTPIASPGPAAMTSLPNAPSLWGENGSRLQSSLSYTHTLWLLLFFLCLAVEVRTMQKAHFSESPRAPGVATQQTRRGFGATGNHGKLQFPGFPGGEGATAATRPERCFCRGDCLLAWWPMFSCATWCRKRGVPVFMSPPSGGKEGGSPLDHGDP